MSAGLDWNIILAPVLSVLVMVMFGFLGMALTGLTNKLNRYLGAKGNAQASNIVSGASAIVQVAMDNEAGRIRLKIATGEIKASDALTIWNHVIEGAKRIRDKVPDSLATLNPIEDSIEGGIVGKIVHAMPVANDAITTISTPLPRPPIPSLAKTRPNRTAFFDVVRAAIFGGHLVHSQVDGCERILDFWDAFTPEGNVRHLAYILATACWETGHAMQPVEEAGRGTGHPYGAGGFYGRGLVQLTLETNYRKMSAIVGEDLTAHPEKALDWPVSLKILFVGMATGMFTGRKLSDFFNASIDDPVGARTIVNGHDHAQEVALMYQSFLTALKALNNQPEAAT